MSNSPGTLFVVATPIGNLEDISQRAVRTLETVNIVAAEDTRKAAILKMHHRMNGSLVSLHAYNEHNRSQELVQRLLAGENVALISDAGTPLISDPGFELVRYARQQGIRVVPIPGPSALLAALSVSGLAADAFIFEGFVPAKSVARKAFFGRFVRERRTVIFYESKHRVSASVDAMREVLGGERGLVLARELTKIHETIVGDSIAQVQDYLKAHVAHLLGEFVLILAGAAADSDLLGEQEIFRHLNILLEELPASQAAALTAKLTGCDRKNAYRLALSIKNRAE